METYTVALLVDGVKVGGQRKAVWQDVVNLMTAEDGLDTEFMDELHATGHAMTFDKHRVFPTDNVDTVSILVAYKN